ncbi:MAG: hypothetical protein QOJ65_2470, partial [Fimbriimonadaceae bacterium]|nr:hypothetical protein [Fimbriimonadaceae bacterium]
MQPGEAIVALGGMIILFSVPI